MKKPCSGHECRIKKNTVCVSCKSKPMTIRLYTIESNPKQIHHYFAFESQRDSFYKNLTTNPQPLNPKNSEIRLNKSHIDIKIEDTKKLNDIEEL